MDLQTFDNRLHDAELKLKRLRSLYEQYFQGIERIEPAVPKKDLERLFKSLHKDKPRNTAARFRLQQLQASYNTYQMYWSRIVRRIEEGTYERDLRRVRARRRAAPAKAEPVAIELDIDVDAIETDDILAALSNLEQSGERPVEPPKKRLTAFSPFGGGLAKPAAEGATKSGAAKGRVFRPLRDTQAEGRPAPSTAAAAGLSSTRVDASPPAASAPSGSLLEADRRMRTTGVEPASRPSGSLLDLDFRSRETKTRPKVAARPQPTAPKPPAPPTQAQRASAKGRVAPPGPPPPPNRVRKGPPPPPGARPPRPDAPPQGMKRLYDDYVAARRRNNQPVDNLKYDKLAARVKQMEAKLRQKHTNRKIGFEVVVKDGRVGLKPKIE
ncbi:MAG: MXAN_5187 C-terminal domain-containing protein [Sandaracinaceae bacterium]